MTSKIEAKHITIPSPDMYVNDQIKKWDDYVYPHGYYVRGGLLFFGEDEEICRTYLILCGKTRILEDGSRYYAIRFEIDNEQKEFLIKQGDIQLKNKLAVLLGSHCIIAPDVSLVKKTQEYLTQCMNQYGNHLKIIHVTEQNGWNEDLTVFALGKTGITETGIIPIQNLIVNKKHLNVFEKAGTQEGWVKTVTPIMKYDLMRFMFYDSMTAPLLKLLNLESHSFEHPGKTSSEKTNIEKVIASAIGNIKEQLIVVGNTNVELLAHVIAMSDIPTFIEEVTTKKSREVVKTAIYEIANETERSMGSIDGKLRRDIKSFKAVTHITCEGSIREQMDHAGEMFRLNSMEEMLPSGIGAEMTYLKSNVEKNVGFFFPKYIQCILSHDVEELYEGCKINVDYTGVAKENIDIAERSKGIYQGIMVAGYLCEEVFADMGLETRSREQVNEIVNGYFEKCILKTLVELDHIRALRMIHDWTVENYRNFESDNNDKVDYGNCYGNMKGDYVDIIGTVFTKKMNEWGFSAAVVKKGLLEEGIIKGNRKGFMSIMVNGITTNGVRIDKRKMQEKLRL
jgi:putative DNA primase/helicase